MGSVFNILGCSAALLCHFACNPVAHAERRQLHRLLLNGLRDAPREIPLRNLQHVEGHCYAFKIDEDLPDDRYTNSTIVLFEDGRSLPRWHFREAKKIASEGLGTYQHAGRVIYFSTSDNTSPLQNGRKYTAVHSLTVAPEAFSQLQNWKQTTAARGAAKLFEMLRILWPRHFGFEQALGDGPDASLSGVRLSIDRDATMTLRARSISVRARSDGAWEFEIGQIATAADPNASWDVSGCVNLAPNADTLVPHVAIKGPGGFMASFDCASDGVIAATFDKLGAIRPAMRAWFNTEDALGQWAAWIGRLATAPLADGGFGLSLDDESLATLGRMFTPKGADHRYELVIHPAAGRRDASLKQVRS